MLQAIINLLDYIFNFSPTREFPLQYVFWILIVLSIGVAVSIFIKPRHSEEKFLIKALKEYPTKLITLSVLLAINLFSRLNRIDVLSMRLITFVLGLWILFTFYEIYNDFFVKYPELKAKQAHQPEKNRQKYHIVKNKKKKHRQR